MRPVHVLLLVGALLASPCRAADPVTDAMQSAYAAYRTALFRTNSQAQAESQRALDEAAGAWQALSARFAAAPPVPYAGDARFGATLDEVSAVYRGAAPLVASGRLAEAHEALEQVRDLLADLRQRNGVVVYSDAMNAYHAQMERVLKEGPALARQPQGALPLMAAVGVLDFLAQQLQKQASPVLRQQPGFGPALEAVLGSVTALKGAALAQDGAAVQRAMAGLKAPYSRLFLQFG